jgi:anti-sigma28 factor (negative regulator of flagellin synthesis)
MQTDDQIDRDSALAHIARPESVVMLAATVRAARELQRPDRIDGLKERLSDGDYEVSSKDLAQRVLSTEV